MYGYSKAVNSVSVNLSNTNSFSWINYRLGIVLLEFGLLFTTELVKNLMLRKY